MLWKIGSITRGLTPSYWFFLGTADVGDFVLKAGEKEQALENKQKLYNKYANRPTLFYISFVAFRFVQHLNLNVMFSYFILDAL
ncbi:MAG: hypothetical protein CVU90_01635 [Firmicutes bacterium HGW-Firmicutes-15]|nr:MAG: hypothetical protein CVU90_01635 [Firmicutes bacterium HGW-Firmicutes-15]